jgi:hypothetical protein
VYEPGVVDRRPGGAGPRREKLVGRGAALEDARGLPGKSASGGRYILWIAHYRSHLEQSMTKISPLADPSILDVPRPKSRELSPKTIERLRQEEEFRKLIAQLTDDEKVFLVSLEPADKPLTVRRRLQRVAEEAGKDIAIRPYEDGFAVGLMTPDRRSRRGRPRKAR